MPDYLTTDTELTSVANAIRTKGGTSSPLTYPAGFVSAIENIPTGGGGTVEALTVTENGTYTAPSGTAYSPVTVNVPSINPDDLIYQDGDGNIVLSGSGETGKVIFIDYDGTELYRYYKSQVDDMESLPANPTHTGLTAQGWNWTLQEIKTYLTSYPEATITVGQMYNTTSGATEIEINLDDQNYLSPYLLLCVNGSVEINWGDGTSVDTLSGTSLITILYINHTYSSIGKYVIKITSINNSIYNFNNNTISQCGIFAFKMPTNYNDRKRDRTYNSKIISIRIGNGYNTNINSNSFANCTSIEYLTIPNSVTSIGSSVFYGCYSLKHVTIPNNITSIGSSAFYGCYSIINILIPDSVTSIESSAFYNCYSLKHVTIPSSVTSIGPNAFYGCYSLKHVTIPNNVTSIENYAFQYCYSLKSIKIPNGVTSINNYAFQACYSFESIEIPSGVTSIKLGAFASCANLKSIELPNTITSIESNAFQYCYSLEHITIPSSVTSIGGSAFQNCTRIKSIEIPNTIRSIETSVFSNCYNLESIEIPNTIRSIGNSAFNNCGSLNSITIPNNVTAIGSNAFYYCASLKTVTIPSGITNIGGSAFSSCYGVYEYHILPETPPTLSGGIFSSIINDTIIYVPYSADHSILEAYKTATNWSTVASYMQEEPQS